VSLSPADYVVFFCYMIAVVLIGFWVARKEKATAIDYFLAGDNLPWFAIGFSMIASSISTEQFIGEVGFAYPSYNNYVGFFCAVLSSSSH
jgi:SSS family solute:Na+ symporter